MKDDVLRFGVAGLGGYAATVTNLLMSEQARIEHRVVVSAVCDPEPERHPQRVQWLRLRGVQVVETLDEMLAVPAEAVWLPVPIHLHRSFTEASLAAGRAVMCEKPPAATVTDLDEMAAAVERSARPLLFGYQDIYNPSILRLKRLLRQGRIGRVHTATIADCRPRDRSYFGRNGWAGRAKLQGQWVLDSILSNAAAHTANLALFLLGQTDASSADPVAVEGELYRANPIEMFDTACLRVMLADGSSLLIAMTHACTEARASVLTLHGECGCATVVDGCVCVESVNGATESFGHSSNSRVDLLRVSCDHFRGRPAEALDGALATPQVVRPHLALCNAAYAIIPVHSFPTAAVSAVRRDRGIALIIPGIEPLIDRAVRERKLFSELKPSPDWVVRPSSGHIAALDVLPEPQGPTSA
jgi:predicted dehydrogenase